MSEQTEEAQRRENLIRGMGLILGGMGRCPGCQQQRDIFYRRRTISAGKERCLDCWRAER